MIDGESEEHLVAVKLDMRTRTRAHTHTHTHERTGHSFERLTWPWSSLMRFTSVQLRGTLLPGQEGREGMRFVRTML